MKYPVTYHTDGWQSRARHPMLPQAVEDCQIVRQTLEDGRRLYVELARFPGAPVRVLVARLEASISYAGKQRYRTVKFLQPDELDLIEIPGTSILTG